MDSTDERLARALKGAYRAEAVQPVEIKLRRAEQQLVIRWADDHISTYSAGVLRRNCPCAGCREERRNTSPLKVLPLRSEAPLTLTGVEAVGSYAIKPVWSDGHDTGIFDYKLLRALDEEVTK